MLSNQLPDRTQGPVVAAAAYAVSQLMEVRNNRLPQPENHDMSLGSLMCRQAHSILRCGDLGATRNVYKHGHFSDSFAS